MCTTLVERFPPIQINLLTENTSHEHMLHTMKVKVLVEFHASVAISSIDCWRWTEGSFRGRRINVIRFGCRSNRRFASPCGDQPDFAQPIMPEFLISHHRHHLWYAVFLFPRDLRLLSTLANSVNCKYLLRVKTAAPSNNQKSLHACILAFGQVKRHIRKLCT